MNSYTQHFHTITHKYQYTVKYRSGRGFKTATGVIEHTSADNVILELLVQYPNCTGQVNKVKK